MSSTRHSSNAGVFSILELFLVFLIVVTISLGSFFVFHLTDTIPTSLWKTEATYTITTKINKLGGGSGGSKDSHYKWHFADLDNGNVLINPFFSAFICDLNIRPRDEDDYMIEYGANEMEDKSEGGPINMRVKKIPTKWVSHDKKSDITQNCPNVDMSGTYLKYRGRDIVELVKIR